MLSSIINLAERHGLVKKIFSANNDFTPLRVGPVGNLLLHNLKNEWLDNIAINNDTSMFLSSNFEETLDYAKTICSNQLPFGIVEEFNKKDNRTEQFNNLTSDSDKIDIINRDFDNLFVSSDKCSHLQSTVFVSEKDSVPFFHQWQKQRRMWWRKFSASPGRYVLTDIKTDKRNVQSCEIVSKYSWKDEVIEKLRLHPQHNAITNNSLFRDGRKIDEAHVVISQINLLTLFFNTICDAYDESDYKGNKRTFFRFHRKLAPYRIAFSITSSSYSVMSELNELALYLTKQLRSNHVSTLFLPNDTKRSLDAKRQMYDEMGIPYCVVLNENTLKYGIALLRSRDTTLMEQVHVSELTAYVEKLFKNY